MSRDASFFAPVPAPLSLALPDPKWTTLTQRRQRPGRPAQSERATIRTCCRRVLLPCLDRGHNATRMADSSDGRSAHVSVERVHVRHLEIHVAHACNLTCESCSHYSNQGHNGYVSLAEADRWLTSWSKRLSLDAFSLLGGEPTIHPDLANFVVLARAHWPTAYLRLVTNGFFLHRHPRLPLVLQGDPNACLYLSVHHNSPEYRERLRPIMDLVEAWVRDYGIRVEFYESFKYWTRRYHGSGHTMEPFSDSQPRQSWERCPAKTCPQIFEGRIWKCAPLAYLRQQHARHRLSAAWAPYLQYQPLDPGCSDGEIAEFFRREEEPSCAMCPAAPVRFELPIPLTLFRRSSASGDHLQERSDGSPNP